jgi:hypothetical protein
MLFIPAFLKGKCRGATRRQEVLAAARTTAFYRELRLNDLNEAEPVSIVHFRKEPGLFRNPLATPGALREFEHPQTPAPKTLLLEEGFRQAPGFLISASGWCTELAEFKAGSIAAAPHRLISLGVARSRPKLTHSIVAFVGPEFGALTPEDRDLLWTCFGVPVYEQLRGLGRELLAAECDAHEGLHIREEDAVFEEGDELLVTSLRNLSHPVLRLRTGLRGKITTKLCGCGEPGPRLIDLERTGEPLAVPSTLKRSAQAEC